MFRMFTEWNEHAEKLKSGEIIKENYDHWRYNYLNHDSNDVGENSAFQLTLEAVIINTNNYINPVLTEGSTGFNV